jgi:3-dehydroquinate synthase
MQELQVNLNERSYAIKIASGLLNNAGALLRGISGNDKIMLVSNPTVYTLYGSRTLDSLKSAGFIVHVALMPDGEAYKNMAETIKILDQGLACGLERGSMVAALGGGVVGDLAGFAAAIYQRGIDFVQFPTTLLAQVDSSVGGKAAVNHPRGKNLIGAFHQPRLVVIDTDTLNTLEERDYHSGLGEVFKYGIVNDKAFFVYLEEHGEQIAGRDKECLSYIIYQSCRIKSAVVAADEKEEGGRAVLNLGHTFGHAIEQLTGYGSYRHGEAVAMGTMAAVYLALDEGLLLKDEARRIKELYRKTGIPIVFPQLDPAAVYQAMLKDKKVVNGRLRLILPAGIGAFTIRDDCRREKILKAIVEAQKEEF